MPPRYQVTLTSEERNELEAITQSGKTHAKRFIHSRGLPLCDSSEDGQHGMLRLSRQRLELPVGRLDILRSVL